MHTTEKEASAACRAGFDEFSKDTSTMLFSGAGLLTQAVAFKYAMATNIS
jgi:hypothetical protein